MENEKLDNQNNETDILIQTESKVEKVSIEEINTQKEDELVDKIMEKILKIK